MLPFSEETNVINWESLHHLSFFSVQMEATARRADLRPLVENNMFHTATELLPGRTAQSLHSSTQHGLSIVKHLCPAGDL